MQWEAHLFMVVTVLTAGLLGILGLLVVYIARGVNSFSKIAQMLQQTARLEEQPKGTPRSQS
jgi:hypothetical protein